MRIAATLALLSALPGVSFAADGLTFDQRIELTRGLMAEFATVKVLLPRTKKPLEFESSGTWDHMKWDAAAKEFGPAARNGDEVQITKVSIENDRLILQINGGIKGGHKWYEGVQITGVGGGTVPIGQSNSNAVSGTTVALVFPKPLESLTSAQVKKMLTPVLDFEKHSATELYVDTLTPETKQAIQDKRVIVGMTRDQVMLAVGRPAHKSRETDKDGLETEDWVFGQPPGKITFVTFSGEKVIRVKDEYAGLGTEVADPKVPR